MVPQCAQMSISGVSPLFAGDNWNWPSPLALWPSGPKGQAPRHWEWEGADGVITGRGN